MKTKYLLTVPENVEVDKATVASIGENIETKGEIDYAIVSYKDSIEDALNAEFDKIKDSTYTHVCIINNGSILRDHARATASKYVDNEECVYLPIVELCNEPVKAGESVVFRGFLNSSVWKPYFATEIGVLDLALSKRGVDLIMDGCYIPKKVATKFKLNPEVKHFSGFEYFNRIISAGVEVVGIPKITLRAIKDYELKNVSKEDKLKYFKLAQESAMTKDPVAVEASTEK